MKKITYLLVSILLVLCLLATSSGRVLAAEPIEPEEVTYFIYPGHLLDWEFNAEGGTGANSFIQGPGTPPLGTGSIQLQIVGPGDEYTLYTYSWGGLLLGDLLALSYSTYHDSLSTGAITELPALVFNIDYDLTDGVGWAGRLIYEPSLTPDNEPDKGIWQTWDAMDGMWWATESPGNDLCPREAPCTLDALITAFPNIGVAGGIGFKVGPGWENGFIGNVDNFVIGNNLITESYDFEPAFVLDEIDLWQTIDLIAGPWELVPGSLADGFTLTLDPLVAFYYLDSNSYTATNTIKDGYHEFFVADYPLEFFNYWAGRGVVDGATGWQGVMWEIINGDSPIFYLKVAGSDIMLVDGLQYQLGQGDKPLRIEGTYLPGFYTFSGMVTDTLDRTDQVDVDIAFNDIPVANGQNLTTDEDIPLPITLTADDTYPGTLQWVIVTPPEHGDISGVAPSITYTPDTNYFGSDSFTFKVNDGDEDSNIATIALTVDAVNDAPVAVADSFLMNENTTLESLAPGVLVNDTDTENTTLIAIMEIAPQHGDLVLNTNGSFTYTPDADYSGTDTFTYHASDGDQNSNTVTVTITISDVTFWIFMPVIHN